MTSEDKYNVSPIQTEATDKPKRGRRRKVEAETKAEFTSGNSIENQSFDTLSTATADDRNSMHPSQDTALNIIEEPSTPVITGSGCGNILKAARETQGLSIHEVCSQLRLGVKQIQAIEQDDFEKLPQPSIVRGFIRNYARLLNIDVAPVLEAYQRMVPNTAPLSLNVRSNASRSVIDKPARTIRPQRIITFFVFLILAAILAYFYINHIKPQALKNPSLALDVDDISETTGQEIPIPAPATDAAAPQSATEIPGSLENTAPTPLSSTTDASANPNTNTSQSAPIDSTQPPGDSVASANTENTVVSTPTPAVNNVIESTTLKASDPQKANLTFKVSEDSWVRIEDMQGKKILSQVLTAGTEHNVVAEKPVNVIVGHAQGTQLMIDNQPYDLTQATRGRVARIQLK